MENSFQILIHDFVMVLVAVTATYLIPTMIMFFFLTVILKGIIYFTLKREEWYVKEFEKRTHNFIENLDHRKQLSFFTAVKKLLELTYYESFVIRSLMKRRKPDAVMSVTDRLFLIQQGVAFMIKDTMKQIMFLRKDEEHPKFLEISNTVFKINPCFNKVFGLIPSSAVNDILNLMPGMFIVGGIFGTFLGIMEGLPKLAVMDLESIDATKQTMNEFLLKISFSMSTSIIGILLSVLTSFVSSFLSPENVFMRIVEKYENTLDLLWNRSTENLIEDSNDRFFDENKDPLIALAETSIEEVLDKSRFYHKRYKITTVAYNANAAKDVVEAFNLVKQEDRSGKGPGPLVDREGNALQAMVPKDEEESFEKDFDSDSLKNSMPEIPVVPTAEEDDKEEVA